MNLIAGAIVWLAAAILLTGACLVEAFASTNRSPSAWLFLGALVCFAMGIKLFAAPNKISILNEPPNPAKSKS